MQAAVVVCDFSPLRVPLRWVKSVAAALDGAWRGGGDGKESVYHAMVRLLDDDERMKEAAAAAEAPPPPPEAQADGAGPEGRLRALALVREEPAA